jgi:outer membrane protein assembly factor BamB
VRRSLAAAALALAAAGCGGEPPASDLAHAATPPVQSPAPWVTAEEIGRPINDTIAGLTMFRGNATRSWFGSGPVPRAPRILWRYPSRPMCSISVVGRSRREWCGTGWTGQPSVVRRAGGLEVIFGAYDRRIHFLDAATGRPRRPSFLTGDIIKGSVTLDPDGFPLVYSGSRDNFFHIVATDRPSPTELWRLSAASAPRPLWNDDWDGNAVVIEDYLFEGGENGWFYIVKLNRRYDDNGLVQVSPEVVVMLPGYDDEQLADLGDEDVSIENSVLIFGNRAWFANSGGLVSGVDLTHLRTDPARVERTFRFWGGDDINATMVIDERGYLYVGAEDQRRNARMREIGQLYSLDPSNPGDPVRWRMNVARSRDFGGIYATPALFGQVLFVVTHAGALMAVDRDSGTVRWQIPNGWHSWSSPVVVDSTLILADCEGRIRAWDVRVPDRRPPLLWEFRLPSGACIESTPAVFEGTIYVGARDGYFYAIGDRRPD